MLSPTPQTSDAVDPVGIQEFAFLRSSARKFWLLVPEEEKGMDPEGQTTKVHDFVRDPDPF